MSEETRKPELAEVEAALKTLAPAPSRIDRDRLMFLAGRASQSRRWFWPCTAFAMTGLAAGLASFLFLQPQPQQVERVVYLRLEQPASENFPISPSEAASRWDEQMKYLKLQERVFEYGLDGLPDSKPSPAPRPPLTIDSLLNGQN